LRGHIGYVPQDNFLFSDTIKNNIGFAYEQIGEDKLLEVGKLADIHDDVMGFKEQYETILGERGVTISGGQKQRVSIARALAKDPTILILDDSVSAVDTKTEEDIIRNLRRVRKGKTTLMIAPPHLDGPPPRQNRPHRRRSPRRFRNACRFIKNKFFI
jgi:ATP-binding cassette subfamily B protein